MKFAVAGILIALAACASSGLVPYTYSQWPAYAGSYAQQVAVAPVAYSAYSAPITQYSSVNVAAAPVAYSAYSAPITQYSSVSAAQAPVVARSVVAPSVYAAPAANVVAAPAVVAAPVVKAVQVGASYTAVNRGAVHQAPLEGHAVSQTSLNLAPAPGTY